MEWRLRRAVADDAAALSLVASAAFLDAFAGFHEGADIVAHCALHYPAERFAEWIADPASVTILAEAEDGGAPIGYSLLTQPDLPVPGGPGDIELKRIYTIGITYGSGLGGALMARAIADARANGASRMLLGVNVRNHRALAFYRKQGFEIVGERRFLMGTAWQDDHVLARAI